VTLVAANAGKESRPATPSKATPHARQSPEQVFRGTGLAL
jgi:hypothetical protein